MRIDQRPLAKPIKTMPRALGTWELAELGRLCGCAWHARVGWSGAEPRVNVTGYARNCPFDTPYYTSQCNSHYQTARPADRWLCIYRVLLQCLLVQCLQPSPGWSAGPQPQLPSDSASASPSDSNPAERCVAASRQTGGSLMRPVCHRAAPRRQKW